MRQRTSRWQATCRSPPFPDTLAGMVEKTEPFGPEEKFVRGWAIDTSKPNEPLWLAAYCSGRQAALVRASRMRPDIAAERFNRGC
jgi:hypothetical protein